MSRRSLDMGPPKEKALQSHHSSVLHSKKLWRSLGITVGILSAFHKPSYAVHQTGSLVQLSSALSPSASLTQSLWVLLSFSLSYLGSAVSVSLDVCMFTRLPACLSIYPVYQLNKILIYQLRYASEQPQITGLRDFNGVRFFRVGVGLLHQFLVIREIRGFNVFRIVFIAFGAQVQMNVFIKRQ